MMFGAKQIIKNDCYFALNMRKGNHFTFSEDRGLMPQCATVLGLEAMQSLDAELKNKRAPARAASHGLKGETLDAYS